METNIKVLGWLHIIMGAIGIIATLCLAGVIFGGGLISGDETAITVTGITALCIGGFLLLITAPGVITGIGLLSYQNWSRVLAIILGVLNLMNFPIGTLLGIYTLYVLLDDETTRLFNRT